MPMESNEVLDRLPIHLKRLIIDQPYHDYTWQDHAVWRYVMRQNVRVLPSIAHESYLDGLRKTGISIDSIPHMYGMNRILSEIGWAAVAVDGFIPPADFMQFQAYNVLVIAADIRNVTQIGYTPAPDIIHEAAGHAPIIANSDYAEYLRTFGAVGSKAFSGPYDDLLYKAVRHLSILKADPYSAFDEISMAEKNLDILMSQAGPVTEMALLRNLHWWTVEYGLVGLMDEPKIYGAGLLSSIAESLNCLQPHVKKIPYSLNAMNYNFDITTQQPQLFVTPDFNYLMEVLDEFKATMAWTKGGITGLKKAVHADGLSTVVFENGMQLVARLKAIEEDNGEVVWLETHGKSMLFNDENELFSSTNDSLVFPSGYWKGSSKIPELLSMDDLKLLGCRKGELFEVHFVSGVVIWGVVDEILFYHGRLCGIQFALCKGRYKGEPMALGSDGVYIMPVWSRAKSVFPGTEHHNIVDRVTSLPEEITHKIVYGKDELILHEYYGEVYNMRAGGVNENRLRFIIDEVRLNYTTEWLLLIEILMLLDSESSALPLQKEVVGYLRGHTFSEKSVEKLIEDGIELLTGKNQKV